MLCCAVLCWWCPWQQNPENKPPGVPSAGPEPDYSPEQRQEFKGYSWIQCEDPTLLDVPGTELLLIGAREEPKGGS